MSDCEERDFFCGSWILLGKTKRKNNSQKNKRCVKPKNNITMKIDESFKKKKKNSEFKRAMEGRKERKQKKTNLTVALDDSFIFTHDYSGASEPIAKSKPELSHLCCTEKLKPDHLTQDSKKEIKRKKRVVFDLSQGYIHVKRPKFVSSSKENILSEKEAVRDGKSCSQVTVTGHSQSQQHNNDSQSTSDDINSQDLFITQKMFGVLPSEPSSGEAVDKAVIRKPQPIIKSENGLHSSRVQIKHHEGSNTYLQDSHFHPHPKKVKEHSQRPRAVQIVLTEEEERLHLAQQNPKKETFSFQRQMEKNTNVMEEKKVTGPVHVKPSVVNPYLDYPIVENPNLDVAKSKKHTYTSRQQSPSCHLNTDEPSLLHQMSKASISTQTENFFTTELSSYHNFCQKSGVTVCSENLKPLDLSLPQRARKERGRCEVKDDEEKCSDQKPSSLPDKMKGNVHKDPNLHPICSSVMKDVEVKMEPSGRHRWSVSAQVKGKTTPSPQSDSESKSPETITSSEDNKPPCSTGKLDLTQLKVVQMRLNESFFFKTKGEEKSLRPESPLMKLGHSREMKSRKGH
ncbi:uncharacterized protein LOC120793409 [Xiphias gladius]|uniref:uncharacterized protein LOC120793409 n=1 Tax=Xiphias gladius TaxID=8245 RepID=UPI001A99C6D0|nr:uncharacterized protein LOC120793409 [Xiphias gladius]